MSDEKKFEQMMGTHVDRQLQRQWSQEYSPKAVKHFSRPANVCEMCGAYMYVDPETGRDHEITEWERKWSIHKHCADMAQERLDRESQMHSRRS